jgi:hypothetical protein
LTEENGRLRPKHKLRNVHVAAEEISRTAKLERRCDSCALPHFFNVAANWYRPVFLLTP